MWLPRMTDKVGRIVTFYIVFISLLLCQDQSDQSTMTINVLTYTREELLGHNTSAPLSTQLLKTIRDTEICSVGKTHRGVTAGKEKQRPIQCITAPRDQPPINVKKVNHSNLIDVP